MTPERWRQIETLYHAARALPRNDRAAYLAAACPDDEALRREVDKLLSQPASDEGLLAGEAREISAGLVTQPAALANRTLGGYELRALIGIGGMGEVYRARDLKLGREVAIKVLPRAFTSDANRLARFDREARTLAALNHPNICAIHGFEQAEDVRFLVLELVGGDTLAERLDASRSRTGGSGLPERDALNIASQIARALDFAHERGIVHRDLKPANIKVTPDGGVKVLDFGLAKATAGDAAGADFEPPLNVTHDGTVEGALLGTPAYMSPEQARGKTIDTRTDIWAFGCVLYEMLTGRAAFSGDTIADTIAKVIEREPDWSALPRSTPEPIRNLLSVCLAKDSQERLREIGSARITIENLLSRSGIGTGTFPTAPRVIRQTPGLKWVVVAALVAVGAWGAWRFGPWFAPEVVEQMLELPAGQTLDGSGGAHVVTISRDSALLAYVASPKLLYTWPIGGRDLASRAVPGTEKFKGVRDAEFSPNGKEVAFYAFADRTIKRMPVAGGTDLTICAAETPTGIHWAQDEVVFFGQGEKGIWRASVNTRGALRIAEVNPGEEAHGPHLLPGGEYILFTIARGRANDRWDHADIVVQSLSTRKRTTLPINGSDARYVPTGHLIYAISGSLWAVRFDLRTLTVQGTAVAVLESVSRATGAFTGAANYSISDNGTLAYVKGPPGATRQPSNIALVDPSGKTKPVKLNAQADRYEGIRVSPDGTTVAAGVASDKETAAIYTIATSGGTSRQLRTPLDSDNRYPAWTRDSRRIAFQSNRGRDLGIWWQAANGSDDARRLTTAGEGESHIPESWSGDGTLLYSVTIKGVATLWTTTVRNGKAGPPRQFGRETSTDPMSAVFSPDGKFVAYTRTDARHRETTVCVEHFPSRFSNKCLEPHLADSPKHPRWSPDGRRLYYDPRTPDFEFVEVITEPELGFGVRQPVAYHPFRLAPPRARTPYDIRMNGEFVGLIPEGQAEFKSPVSRQIVVVRSWFETLKQKFK
jgi:Tol biopolymer transport system component